MKKFLFFSLAAAAIFAGCAKSIEDEAIEAPLRGTRFVTLKAAAETTDSKVAYAGETTFGWQAGDCIGLYVYDHANNSRLYVPADFAGNDGDTNGDFTLTLADEQDYYKVAWYPYFEVNADWTDAGVLTLDFNSQKAFSTLKAGEMPMPMVAYFPDDTDKASLQFKNVGGLVKITVNNVPANARYFKLVADKQISGPFALDLENDQLGTVECTLQSGSAGSNAIEYIYEDGATTELNLYYPVPVGNFKFGFEIYTEAGIVVYKKEIEATSNENTIERGDILRMPAITVTDVAPEYKLIGYREGDDTWSTNLEAQAVAGQYGWFVIKDVRPGASDNLSFKLRKTDAWSPDEDIFGQPDGKFFQVPGKLISLVHPGNDITFVGSEKSYDIYFNEAEQKLFALENPSVFAVPTEAATNNYYHLIGEVGTLNWNKNLPSVDVASFDGWRVIKDVPVNADNKLNFKLRKADDWGDAVVLAYPGGDGTLAVGTVLNASDAGGGNIFVEGASGDKFDVYVNASLKKIIVLKSGETFEYPIISISPVWSKVSTSSEAWNAYFGGTADSDRSIAMDDEYIYLPETRGVAKLWKIKITDPNVYAEVPVGTVTGGTHFLSCPRIVPNTSSTVNGGKDILVVSNLTTDDSSEALALYFYNNGTSADPTRLTPPMTGWGRRLGDKFTYWGTLQKGGFFFKDSANKNAGAFVVYKTAWDSMPASDWFTVRRTNLGADEAGIGNFFPYPGQETPKEGIYTSDNGAQYVTCDFDPTSTSGNTSTLAAASGYYKFAYGFQFFEVNGKKYAAYCKKDPEDGKAVYFFVIGGKEADTWKDVLVTRNVVFSQHIDGAQSSGYGNADCTMRKIGNDYYFAVLRQMNSLSVFKFTVSE